MFNPEHGAGLQTIFPIPRQVFSHQRVTAVCTQIYIGILRSQQKVYLPFRASMYLPPALVTIPLAPKAEFNSERIIWPQLV